MLHTKLKIHLFIVLLSLMVSFNSYSQVQQEWVSFYNGAANSYDAAEDIAVDNAGNVYVVGSSAGANIYDDIVTVKYNSSGVQQWAVVFNGTGNFIDQGNSIKVDTLGNCYITGLSYTSPTQRDIITIKYNSLGVQQWAKIFNGIHNGNDEGTDLELDASLNVYVVGLCNFNTNYYTSLIKYNSAGTQLWAMYYEVTNGNAIPVDMALDNSGNVYIAGSIHNPSPDLLVLKYNTAGAYQWIQTYNGPNNYNDAANSIDVDNSGNAFITGGSFNQVVGNDNDFVTLKYNTNGVQQWVNRYDGTAHMYDDGWSVSIDNSGNCIVTGESDNVGTGTDITTIKYNTLGTQLWVQKYNRSNDLDDFAYSVATGAFNNIYVTGKSVNVFGLSDIVTLKYNPAGDQQWVKIYNGTSDSTDLARKVVTKGLGEVYITGYTKNTGTYNDFITIKYTQSVGIEPISEIVPDKYVLYQNFPNPFNPVTKIRFDVPSGFPITTLGNDKIMLKVYDVMGREVQTLVNERLNPGTYEVTFDGSQITSGVYFYKITAGNFTETKRMIFTK